MDHLTARIVPAERATPPTTVGGVVRAGGRVYLAPPRPSDEAELQALCRRSRDLHRSWVEPPRRPSEWRLYLRRVAERRTVGLFVRRRVDDALAGVVNLNEPVLGMLPRACLGYYADARLAGRGYMTEGVSLALRHAFDDLGLRRIEANIQPDNRPSLALVRRLGFQKEGFSPRYLRIDGAWRDHERWAVASDGWPPSGGAVR